MFHETNPDMAQRIPIPKGKLCEDCARSKGEHPFARTWSIQYNDGPGRMVRVVWLCEGCAARSHKREWERVTQTEMAI